MKGWMTAAIGMLILAATASLAQNRAEGGALNQNLGNPDYGVCRGTDPKCYHDWGVLPGNGHRVLLWTVRPGRGTRTWVPHWARE